MVLMIRLSNLLLIYLIPYINTNTVVYKTTPHHFLIDDISSVNKIYYAYYFITYNHTTDS